MSAKTRSNVRNSYIDLLRFVFCMLIFIHHSGHVTHGVVTLFPSGGIAADTFFMLTGYYAIRHLEKFREKRTTESDLVFSKDILISGNPAAYSMRYTVRKLLKTCPYLLIGSIISYALSVRDLILSGTLSTDSLLDLFRGLVTEVTLLPLTGILGPIQDDPNLYRNAPMWYLSAILLVLPVIMTLAIKFRDIFKNYLVWILPAVLFGWTMNRFGKPLGWKVLIGFLYSGTIRGFIGMMMGASIYYAARALSENRFFASKPLFTTAVEIAVMILFTVRAIQGITGYRQIFLYYMTAVSLTLSFSGITYTSRISWRPFEFLGKLSLPVYCLHWGIYQWVAIVFPELGYLRAIAVTFLICVVISFLIMNLVKFFSDRLKTGKTA